MIWHSDIGSLRQPLMVMALNGMFDAGKAATNAATWIRDHCENELVGELDPEELYNFSESRPLVTFDDSGDREIRWPTVRFYGCRTDGGRDVLVAVGSEPQYKWKWFSGTVLSLARQSGCGMVVTLGSALAMTPHTRPARIVASSGDPTLAARLQLRSPSYEGPTGVVGVVNQHLEAESFPIMSLRAEVPHYVPGSPSPKSTQSLLRRLEQLTRIPTRYEELDGAVHAWIEQVDAAVAADEESRVYLAQLEHRVDADEERLPSGDDVAGELEAYLRELGSGGDDT
ncbi:MAG: PAC2 family protein [Acidimicrobiales bacterium]|nr:PAC2 family protein [Acidimicrobiales bacterium]